MRIVVSETPLNFIFRYKGDSVGRYRRYPLLHMRADGVPFETNSMVGAKIIVSRYQIH